MSPQDFSLFLLSIVMSVAGQFLLKVGAVKLAKLNAGSLISYIVPILTTPELIAGLTCYGLGAVVYIALLSRVNLSVAGPSLAIVYVFSVLLGNIVFKEVIPLYRLVGLGLIVAGVILVVWQKK